MDEHVRIDSPSALNRRGVAWLSAALVMAVIASVAFADRRDVVAADANDLAAEGAGRTESDLYSVELPEGWARISRPALEQIRRMTAEARPTGPRVHVHAMFQPAGAETPSYPYAVVNISMYRDIWVGHQPTEEELKSLFETLTKMSASAPATNMRQEGLAIIRKTITTDLAGRRYFMSQAMHKEGVGEVVSMSVDYFGRESLIEFQVYGLADQWEKLEPMAQQMVRSFRLAPTATYDESTPAKSNTKSRDSLGLGLVSLGVIVLLIIARRQREKSRLREAAPPSPPTAQ